ncbi:hypothetical protein JCM10450v2_005396 [Rhodotorula kratochvilovae]
MNTIAVLHPGQMGGSFALPIRQANSAIRLVTAVSQRSARTQELARSYGYEDVGTLEAVLQQSDVVLSVIVPDKAAHLAGEVAAAASSLVQRGERIRTRCFVDLNAVAPSTVQRAASAFADLPLEFVDGGIIGGPATASSAPLVALSGPAAAEVDAFLHPLFLGRTKVVGAEVGQASALKLAYASLAKGFSALALNAALLADIHGIAGALEEELAASHPNALWVMQNSVPKSTAKAFRWVGEMEEIATAFSDANLPFGAQTFQGIAATQQFVADNKTLGGEPIEHALEEVKKGRTVGDVVRLLQERH